MANKKKKSKNEENITTLVSFFQIFRYGNCLELLATALGVVFGMISGAGVCCNLLQIGELSTAFVERTKYHDRLSSYLPLTATFGGGKRLVNATHEQNMEALIDDAKAMAIGMFISIGVSLVFCVLSFSLISWSALRQITRIRTLFLRSVLRQDMSWYDTDSEFNLASKMSENLMSIKEGMGEKLAVVSNLVGTSVICLCTAFPLGWQLTLACAAVMPFSVITSIALSNYQTKSSIREMESYSLAGKQAEEILKSVRTIVAFGGENKEVERYRRLLEPAEEFGRKRGLFTGLGNGFNWVLTYSLNAIGFSYGTRLVVNDFDTDSNLRQYPVGAVYSILFSVYMATQSITFCVPHLEGFAAARGAAASIFHLIEREPKIDSLQQKGLTPRRVVGDILLEDVEFCYPSRPEVKVLKGFSIHVKPGECVALVGSSGCGKSTVLQLLQRLYDPQAGSVKLDGKNLKNLNLSWLRSSLGVVGQEPVLFRGTIYDNIAIGSPEATREEIQRVAEIAYAHDFISLLPNGYDTVIGERGASLSGGQKQRIAIARSLLREPAVLLLDEATSALDPHSERQVQAALDRASVGRTTITVSHRLSTIVNADRIICMDQGVIVEQGTHEDLMKAKGFYHKLVTTGNENKEPADIEPLIEEADGDGDNTEPTVPSRLDVRRRSSKKVLRHHSIKKDHPDWLTPRGSISSMVSIGLQNFVFNSDLESEEDEDEEETVKTVSDWQLLKLNAPEWPLITVGSIAAFLQGACFPVFALLFGFSSGIFILDNRDDIIYLADLYSVLFVVIAAVAGISMCLQSTTFTSAGLKMTTRLRHQYFASLLKQEIGFFDKETNTVGAICARLSGDTAEVQGATGLRIGLILQGISSVVVGFLLAISYNWKLTLVATVFLPLMVGSIWLEGIISQKAQIDERNAMESATAIATEAVVSIKTVQSLGVETVFLQKFQDALKTACVAVAYKTRWRGLVYGLGVYIPFMAYCSATVYGAVLVAYGEMEYKLVLLVNEAIMYGAYMLGQSLVYAPSLNTAKACGARILSIIQRQPKIHNAVGVKDKKDWVASGNFSMRDVEFCYPTRPSQRVLKGIDLKMEAGKTIALVGSSGCGKSTILQLFQRFYDPDSGFIELDNRDIRSALTIPRLRRQLGVVQQEPVLLDRSLAENIAYGDNNRKVTMHEIVAAAKAANIHSFIVSLPKGYETNLGANGAQLSGGQKQRVCIARALIRSPRLLLLDEATSALDASSERAVTEALEKAAKGRTCITIAHRLSTVKDADLICVIDKGKIVERGTHAELVSMKGHYWRMCRGQNMA
ncbi:multidrug resistance protein homolog 49-like [Bombyx mandarina]|uniref:ABC-type xenobiotic transporter n=1 Tax=Bombyx mandarina TaxID=7092 RepID=A0A6J2JZP8_BOMMA|nr:multidrug resistance protein homolog 49-like [Bombyx mandarina]